MKVKKTSKKNNKYSYMLYCCDNEISRTIGDYVIADDLTHAYELVITICNELNSKYKTTYSIQSIIPE